MTVQFVYLFVDNQSEQRQRSFQAHIIGKPTQMFVRSPGGWFGFQLRCSRFAGKIVGSSRGLRPGSKVCSEHMNDWHSFSLGDLEPN